MFLQLWSCEQFGLFSNVSAQLNIAYREWQGRYSPVSQKSKILALNKACARTARLQRRLEHELLWYWHFYWSESCETKSLNNGQRGCMIFSSFLYLPSGKGRSLNLATDFSSLDITAQMGLLWEWLGHGSVLKRRIFSSVMVSQVSFRHMSSLPGPFWLHLSVAFYGKCFGFLCGRWQEFGPCT